MLEAVGQRIPDGTAADSEAAEAAALVARVGRGEAAAEQAFVLRYRRGLVLLLRHWCRDPALAEDLAQEALLITLQRLRTGSLAEPEHLQAFLRRTAHNLLIAGQRRDARRQTSTLGDALPDLPDERGGPEADWTDAHLAQLVRQVVAELPVARDRELLRRHYLEDEDRESLCAEFDLDALHLNRVLHRARTRLRDLLLARGWDGAPLRDSRSS
jgi:RNA polymerase sigma factor (sigma-70 family)